MDLPEIIEDVLDRFRARYLEDSGTGEPRSLSDYLSSIPEQYWAEVARAYLDLRGGSGDGSMAAASDPSSPPGDRLGPYELVRELGRGGQAVVWLARDLRLGDRKVALKVLTDPGFSFEALGRFQREAEITSRLEHPNICTVYEAGIDEETPYIAMRLVQGESLAQRIRTAREVGATEPATSAVELGEVVTPPTVDRQAGAGDREISQAGWLIETAARAVHAAHEAGIIHRDIKPGNIMVREDGEPVIVDFGLARDSGGDLQTLTRSGEIFGTPAYMSPEQLGVEGVRVDRRTDVWSLGVTLYECVTLHRPFDAPTQEGLCDAIRSADPPDPRPFNPAVSDDLRVILETALEKDRARRYQSALDLAEDLRRLRSFEPIHARPASAWMKLSRWRKRNPALAGSLSAGIVFLILGLAVSLFLLFQRDAALRRYDQMSDAALATKLVQEAHELWPRRPRLVPAMEEWLQRARATSLRLPLHEKALEELRARAHPYDEAQRAADAKKRQEIHSDIYVMIDLKTRQVAELEDAIAKLRAHIDDIDSRLDAAESDRMRDRLAGRKEQREEDLETLQAQLTKATQDLDDLEEDPRRSERLSWEFSEARDLWRHEVLATMVKSLRRLGALIADVEDRRLFAASIHDRSVGDHRAAWVRCLVAMATAPAYAHRPELVDLQPLVGLVPLGIDRDSGFWEFWHVESGAQPAWEGADWPSDADADPRGKVQITEGSGIVLVLLPGGSFWMGTTSEEGAQNHDPHSFHWEGPVNRVELDAFFMSKYEVTQGQWSRLFGENPSRFDVGSDDRVGGAITALHPVTNVDWHQSAEALRRWDLELPTEARWEYACRGGTSTAYWCGDTVQSIQDARAGNLADATAMSVDTRSIMAPVATLEVRDGFYLHAPVGSLAANPFGLHDVLGNVMEWCEDRYTAGYQVAPRPGDGLRDRPPSLHRVYRGGHFFAAAVTCRSAHRYNDAPTLRIGALGLRPARSLDP